MGKCSSPKPCARLMRVLADETRLRIIRVLLRAPQCVSEVADGLGLAEARVSHHLSILRAAGVVDGERRGKQVVYAISPELLRRRQAGALDLGCCEVTFRPVREEGGPARRRKR